MIRIDCREVTVDEQIALAGALNEGLGGKGAALIRDDEIVFDPLGGGEPPRAEVVALLEGFIARRKDAEHYSVGTSGDSVVVHSPDPLVRSRGRRNPGLPPNLLQCPFCSFVTPYQEAYDVHFRSHGFAAGF